MATDLRAGIVQNFGRLCPGAFSAETQCASFEVTTGGSPPIQAACQWQARSAASLFSDDGDAMDIESAFAVTDSLKIERSRLMP
jgi:hypothetical protein